MFDVSTKVGGEVRRCEVRHVRGKIKQKKMLSEKVILIPLEVQHRVVTWIGELEHIPF